MLQSPFGCRQVHLLRARVGARFRAGLLAGLQVGQAYGVFYLPGFGLADYQSPLAPGHPTSICNMGVNGIIMISICKFQENKDDFLFSNVLGCVYTMPGSSCAGTKNISDRAFVHTQNTDFRSIFVLE